MRLHATVVALGFAAFACTGIATAQTGGKPKGDPIRVPDADHIQQITTADGSTLVGRITSVDSTSIRFSSDMGETTIRLDRVSELREFPLSAMHDGRLWFPTPNANRLLFAPTGRSLKAGDGYFADYELFFPFLAYGLTDRLTIAGGMSLFPTGGVSEQVFYIGPKLGLIEVPTSALSVGALFAGYPGSDGNKGTTFGIGYVVGTLGTSDASATLGLGYGFADGEPADKPLVMLGGEYRVARRVSLVTENYVVPGVDGAIYSYGARFFGESLSVDLALINATAGGTFTFPGLPFVGFSYKF